MCFVSTSYKFKNSFIMIKNNNYTALVRTAGTHLLPALLVSLMLASNVNAADWFGVSGKWTDETWGLESTAGDDYPGGSVAEVNARIAGYYQEVTLDEALSTEIGELRVEQGAILNFAAGGVATNILGYNTQWDQATINFTGGTYNINHGLMLGRTCETGGTTQVNISSGTLNYNSGPTEGRVFCFRHENTDGTVNIDISGTGSLLAQNGGRFDHLNLKTVNLNLSDRATFDLAGVFESSNWDMSGVSGIAGLSHTISITGSSVTAEVGGIDAYATDADHKAVIRFTADRSGFSTLKVGTLTLNGGHHAADLIVDLKGLRSGEYDLFDYIMLAGTEFNSVTYLNGTAELDYGRGTSDSITIRVGR